MTNCRMALLVFCLAGCSDSSSSDPRVADVELSPDVADATVPGPDGGSEPDGYTADSPPDTPPPPNIEVAGVYQSDFYALIIIDDGKWGDDLVALHDNDKNFAVIQSTDEQVPETQRFGKVVWTSPEADGRFWTCHSVSGKASAQEAAQSDNVADATTPSAGGCGNFPWTRMVPTVEVNGLWDALDKEMIPVSYEVWGDETVVQFDNESNHAVVREVTDGFGKIQWFASASWRFWYCRVASGLATVADAVSASAAVDTSAPGSGGCKGNPWTELRTAIEVKGQWTGEGGDEQIGSFVWNNSMFGDGQVAKVQNTFNKAIVRHSDTAVALPGTYSRVAWTDRENDGGFWYCVESSGHSSFESAEGGVDVANPDALKTIGCGGGPWTHLLQKAGRNG